MISGSSPRPVRVAIYTAIYGGYDSLKPQPPCPGADFICFTDDAALQCDGWKVRTVRPRYEHPRLAAKWFKMRPDRALPRYRYTIWIDGSVSIKSKGFASKTLEFMNGSGLALFHHPTRSDLRTEAEHSLRLPKYAGLRLREQVEHYSTVGYDGDGLYAATVLVRDSLQPRIRSLGRLWMRENLAWSYQDQLSLPYLLWRLDILPGIIPHDLWRNPLFAVYSHASDL